MVESTLRWPTDKERDEMEEVCSIGEVWSRCLYVCFFSGRIDCRKAANCRYYIYSAAENQHFRGFRPAGATRCTDLHEIWHGRGARWSAWPREFSRESVHGGGSGSASSEESFWSISFYLPNTDNLTRTTKKQNTYKRKLGAQKNGPNKLQKTHSKNMC